MPDDQDQPPTDTAPARRRRRPRALVPLSPAGRRAIDVEVRRYLAARRRLDARAQDLAAAVHAARVARADPVEIAAVIATVGLPAAEWPAVVAAQLAPPPAGPGAGVRAD